MILPLFVVIFMRASNAQESVKVELYRRNAISFNKTCSTTSTKGPMWSTCEDKMELVNGCVSVTGKKYWLGDTFVDSVAKWECVKEDDEVKLVPVACVLAGQVLEIGEYDYHEKYYYKCTKDIDGVGLKIIGCSDTNEDLVTIGNKFVKKNFVYKCEKEGDKTYTVVVGCVYNYHEIEVGTTYVFNSIMYECQRKGKRSARFDMIGCADKLGRLINPGETFTTKIAVVECIEVIKEDGTTDLILEPVGCAEEDQTGKLTRKLYFGDTWYKPQNKDIGFRLLCQKTLNQVDSLIIACEFVNGDEKIYVPVGCGTVDKSQRIYVCKEMERNRIAAKRLSTVEGKTIFEVIQEQKVSLCSI